MTAETRNGSEVIDLLGGVAALASRLGVSKQCVTNWRRRGIPPQVVLQNLQVFYPYLDKLRKDDEKLQQDQLEVLDRGNGASTS